MHCTKFSKSWEWSFKKELRERKHLKWISDTDSMCRRGRQGEEQKKWVKAFYGDWKFLCGVKLLSCPLALRRDSKFVFWAQLRESIPYDLGGQHNSFNSPRKRKNTRYHLWLNQSVAILFCSQTFHNQKNKGISSDGFFAVKEMWGDLFFTNRSMY